MEHQSKEPLNEDPTERTIRRNLIRFRERLKWDQFAAALAANIPYEDLVKYELGEAVPSNVILVRLAKLYGREPGDFFKEDPPEANLDDVPWVHFLVAPGVALSEEQKRRLANTAAEVTKEARAEKRAVLDHLKKVKAQRKKP